MNPSFLLNQECKFCKNMTAKKIQNSIPNQSSYYCSYCKHTYTTVDNNMSRKKKKKNQKKTTVSQAAKNQKVINETTTEATTEVDDSWEVEIDCVEACSKAPENITVWFLPLAKRKVDTLMKEYSNIEWLAYLLGPKDSKDVEDIFIPDQSISSARVDDIECEEFNDLSIIGVIHSHHTMGHSFSGTDHDYINGNHDISIVVSHSGLAGQYRYKTPCGAYKIVDINVRLKVDLDFNDEKFIEAVKPKLVKKSFTTYYGNGYAYGMGGGGEYVNGQWRQSGQWRQNCQGWPDKTKNELDNKKNDEKDIETNNFLNEAERLELEAEVEELDFTKELTLAEEMELLDNMDGQEDKETN